MKLKVTLRRAPEPADLLLTADATATVADVARALHRNDPATGSEDPGPLTLAVRETAGSAVRTLDGDTTLADSALLSGASIELVRAGEAFGDAVRGEAVARLRVIGGPDAGLELPLPSGSFLVGRDRSADVRLSDPMISKRHARINVGTTLEIVDLGSANGVMVSGDQVGRATLATGDTILLGDTMLTILRLQQPPGQSTIPQIDHVRSPRLVLRFPGQKIVAPLPPKLPQLQRMPWLALISPLLLGFVTWALTQQILGAVMMGLSPILMLAGFIDQKLTASRQLKRDRKTFDESMLRTQDRLDRARQEERRARLLEMPSTGELFDDASRLGPLLWTERPELPSFLAVNLGTGRLPSRNQLELPQSQDTVADCWEQLLQLEQEFATVDDVPVVVQLRDSGSLGYAGPEGIRQHIANGAVFQLAARHSPAELVIAALLTTSAQPHWDWLKWLPHTSSAHSPIAGAHLADNRGTAGALLSALEGLIESRLGDDQVPPRGPLTDENEKTPAPVIPAVVVLVEHGAPVDPGRITRVLERGPEVGVHVIWCAPHVEQLPAACRSYLSLDGGGRDGIVGQVRLGERMAPVTLEALDPQAVQRIARMLAPVVDIGTPDEDDSDLPRGLAYPDVAGTDILDSAESITERWRQNNSVIARDGEAPVPRRKAGTLRAVIGHAGTEPFALDLRADGPHALVGGTTGSGKSEFLQSWVLGMAAAHSPDRLTFLFVDYKGGSAFADCIKLPHTVGLVTDLSPHLVRRALTSLKAELHYREHLLNAKKAKDLVTLEKSGDPDCPPSLIIVIDEFAALANEVPEFVDGVVDVAQRGRSLGLHLIMATQRPSGVIRENLRANTNLRIALRMADAEDSMDILGERMAAYFDPSIPGRGAAKTGPGRIKTFQTGYVGGHTTGEPPVPRIEIEELDFGGHTRWEAPQAESVEAPPQGPTDIARIVDTIGRAAAELAIPAPRKPWLDELAGLYSFRLLPNPRTDERLPLGVLDEPQRQSQPTVYYEPDRDGNLAIFGTGGSGKSTVLRTLAIAAGLTARNGGPTQVYGLDFGSRGLSMLEALPHVGAIIPGDDEERVIRTIRMLRDLVDERAVRYAAVRAGSIGEYRHQAAAPDEARILLLVDGIGTFKEQYEFGPANLSPWFTAFAQIAADGRAVGVHIVVTADRPNALPTSIASTVQRRIVLRLAHEDEYLLLGVARDVLGPASPPGRGILDDTEVQIAVLGDSGNVAVQAREIERLAQSLARAVESRPAPILSLPDHIWLNDLPAGTPEIPVIGIDDLTLGPAALQASGTLLLAGPPSSGRTTALGTLAAAVARTDPSTQRVLFAPRRSALAQSGWSAVAEGATAVTELAQRLSAQIESGSGTKLALFIEAVPEFTGSDAEYELDRLIRVAAREEHFVVGEGEVSTWAQAYTLAQPFKAGRVGLLLAPGEMDADNLFGISLGRIRRSDFPAGRGFLIAGGRASKLHVAQSRGSTSAR